MNQENLVEVVKHEGHAVVYPQGYLNGPTGREIDTACADLIRTGHDRIIINFAHTETINTMGIANLISIIEKVGRNKGAICFSNLVSTSRQMLEVLDISSAVVIFDEEAQAATHLAGLSATEAR